jgi:GntR family transcriptional regulator, rspAB operon transcriptional repressor
MTASLDMETVPQGKDQAIHQWVYQVLRTNIIKLRLEPARAISENEISDFLGISRTPVREAFIRLAEDGLIKVTPQKRSLVSLIDLEQAEEARFIRRAVEKAVIREACARFSEADRRVLRAGIKAQRGCARDKAYDGMLTADNDFHRAIFAMCGRDRSWLYLKKLDFNYDRLRTMVIPHVLEQIIGEHQQILDVIARGSVERIEETVDRHLTWADINRVVHQYPPEFFAQIVGMDGGNESRGMG